MGNAVREEAKAGNADQSAIEEATRELEILQRSPELDRAAEHETNRHQLFDSPIPAAWVLEGEPRARNKLLSGSTDKMASTYMWDCTAGRFNWFYDIDETICLVEGSAVITDEAGVSRKLRAGDTYYFARGTRAEWKVGQYVRKIAFFHVPLSEKVQRFRRILKALKRIVKPGEDKEQLPTLFAG